MVYCTNCGKESSAKKFCEHCGVKHNKKITFALGVVLRLNPIRKSVLTARNQKESDHSLESFSV